MNDEVMDELGPIDYLVVEFPAGKANFSGEMAEKLRALVEGGTVRVLDLLIITKDEGGEVDAFELLRVRERRRRRAPRVGRRVRAAPLRGGRRPTSPRRSSPALVAAALVWENTWAAPFAASIRHSGGQLVASGRIPMQAIIAAARGERRRRTDGRSLRCLLDQDAEDRA